MHTSSRYPKCSRSGLLAMAALQLLGGIANVIHAMPTHPQYGKAPVYGEAPAYGEGPSRGPIPTLVESDRSEYRRPEHPASAVAEYPPPPSDIYEAPVPIGHAMPPEKAVVTVVETESVQVTEVVTDHVTVHETDTVQNHITEHVTVVKKLPPVHVTKTEVEERVVTVTEVSERVVPNTVVRTVVYTETAPTTVIHTLPPVVQTVVQHVTETETRVETKLREVVLTEVQVSHLVQTQVIDRLLTETVHNVLTATKVATQVVDRLLTETDTATETVHSVLTATEVATQVIDRLLTETDTATETVHKVLTATEVATQVVDRLLTETATATETETAIATHVVDRPVVKTVENVETETETEIATATATATQVIHRVQTEVRHSVLTETVNNVVTTTATATQLLAGAPKVVHITSTTTVCRACQAAPVYTSPAATPDYSPPAPAPTYSLPAAAAPAPAGATYTVDVGGTAGLIYTPSWIKAAVGDTVRFTFYSQNHTATQSTFDKPCVKNAVTGADSGFKPNRDNALAVPPTWDYVVDTPNATWWYCAQSTHCGTGMVFAINPNQDKTFEAFKEAAVAQNGTYPITTSSTTAMPSSTSTPPLKGEVEEHPLSTATDEPVPTKSPQESIPPSPSYSGSGAGDETSRQEGPVSSAGDELPSPTSTAETSVPADPVVTAPPVTTEGGGGDKPMLDLGAFTDTALMSNGLVLHIPMPSAL